ncbi:MAG: GTP cyclohydrolase I FolE [Acidimicrobiales bacterium]|jgi:GTP cyclohydrolase I|nr:GTP cyclohydrolase I FolE [Acidimicrobiales bacterium]
MTNDQLVDPPVEQDDLGSFPVPPFDEPELVRAPRPVPAAADPSDLPPVDLPRIEAAVREILVAIGEDPDRDGLLNTPGRVARMYAEVFSGLREAPDSHLKVVFEAEHDEMVMVRDIALTSMCEHHLVPFIGKAHVAYIPNEDGRVTGLSKLARLVDSYAKRPQVQERLTAQIADEIERTLQPRGVLVVVEAEHLCMSMRGVRKPGSSTVTSAVRGLFRDSTATRFEAMRYIERS